MAASSSPLIVAALAAIACAALGPRLVGPRGRPAGAPFAYTPPQGFVSATDGNHTPASAGIASGQKAWVYPGSILDAYTPNITETHTSKEGLADEAEIATLVRGMPNVFARSGITWNEVRHETRTRPDGTRTAVIIGDCTKSTLHYRAMQMVFPDDTGTSIVTASFPVEGASRWEPQLDATMASATGVALRVPPPANWLYVAWGLGGGILAFLAAGVASKRPRSVPDKMAD